jgi:hypothetical protein
LAPIAIIAIGAKINQIIMPSALSTTVDQSPFINSKNLNNTGIKYQLVEIVIPQGTTNTTFKFPTQNFLRMKQILSIEVFTVLDMSVSPLGNALISGANMMSGYGTFYGSDPDNNDDKGEWLEAMPLVSLHRTINGTDPYVRDLQTFVPRNIVWEKSEVDFYEAIGNDDNAVSVLFQVGYLGTLGD